VVGREREGPKLLLNQGPSEPGYATACARQFDHPGTEGSSSRHWRGKLVT